MVPFVISVFILDISGSYWAQNQTELAVFTWFAYVGLLANRICSCVIFSLQNKPVKDLIKRILMHQQIKQYAHPQTEQKIPDAIWQKMLPFQTDVKAYFKEDEQSARTRTTARNICVEKEHFMTAIEKQRKT